MLEISNIVTGYGETTIIHELSLTVKPGEILCLLGRNGAGKTTTMKAIMGLLPLMSGAITLNGETLSDLPAHEVPKHGIGYIPQGRRLFSELTVAENIEIGLMARNSAPHVREQVLDVFPRLRERLNQRANTLSGGEQQMLATARALCVEPSILLLDEPTEGLQPSMIDQIRSVVVNLKQQGVGILLVEQRVDAVLEIADEVAFIENGRNRDTLPAGALKDDHTLLNRYIGVGG